ncbi:MAG: hypothetical protein ACXVCP_19615 [Bdellovibrio sp.]
MKVQNYFRFSILISIFILTSASQVLADYSVIQPSVSRRMIICDGWQWIGGQATTWGCLYIPREVHVAGGDDTDKVIASLQKQITDLEARLKKIEQQKP